MNKLRTESTREVVDPAAKNVILVLVYIRNKKRLRQF